MSAATTTTAPPYERPREVKIANREAWLMAAAERLIGRVTETAGSISGIATRPDGSQLVATAERPKTLRVSCGWPSKNAVRTASSTKRRIGEAWASEASEDKAREVFISPALADEVEVCDVLLHELIHACLPAVVGHKPPFPQIAKAVGLDGKPTATFAGEELVAELRVIAHELGRYPHEKLDSTPKAKKPGRMVKGFCPDCENILYGSRAAWEAALPKCGACAVDYVVDPSPEQAAAWGLAPAGEVEPLENVTTTVELKTKDGRFTLRSTKTGGREGTWTVTDHEAIEVSRRVVEVEAMDGQEAAPELVTFEPLWTIRRTRDDALAFIAAIRSGELSWDAVEVEDADEEPEVDLDDAELWGELGEWGTPDDHLDDDEDEEPDYEDGHFDDAEEEARFQAEADKRDASGTRKSAQIIAADGEGAMD